MCFWNTMPPIMANSKAKIKDKYFDTSWKISSQEMIMCNMEALVSYFFEVMTNVIFFNWSNVKVKRLKYQQKDLITREIHVKCQRSSTQYSKVTGKIEVFKKEVKHWGQVYKVKLVGSHEKALYHVIFMWNIKALAFNVQTFSARLML